MSAEMIRYAVRYVGAIVAFASGAALRPDAAMGLVALGAVFIVLERAFPRRRQVVFRRGFATDCVHFVGDELISAVLLAGLIVVGVPVAQWLVPGSVRDVVVTRSGAPMTVIGMVFAEIAGYWGHRATHEVRFLWRFHRLHHSIETMDWLAPNRRHPVDMALARASVAIPLVALGFTIPTIAAHFAVKRFQGLLVHANVRLNAGPVTWLIATPEFHHWHHADDPAAYNKNYAGQLPLVDWIFGTLHLPRPAWPERYGCGDRAPDGYVNQLLWPFRSSGPATRQPRTCSTENSRLLPSGSVTTQM